MITAESFYVAWLEATKNKKEILLKDWSAYKKYTEHIMSWDDSIVMDIAKFLELECYPQDYYKLDTIFYRKEDRYQPEISNKYIFKDIAVAFEHENDFNSNIIDEVAHLLITNCDLRVLVIYPEDTPDAEIDTYHNIISENRLAKDKGNDFGFLIICGYQNNFEWEGFKYTTAKFKKIAK